MPSRTLLLASVLLHSDNRYESNFVNAPPKYSPLRLGTSDTPGRLGKIGNLGGKR